MNNDQLIYKLLDRISVDARGCFNWTKSKCKGYGRIMIGSRKIPGDRKPKYAHRVSYELFRGTIPPGIMVCHHCDNPACINPAHLFLGTSEDNLRDALRKGRLPTGEENHNAKLTRDAISLACKQYKAGRSLRSISKDIGVDSTTLTKAVTGRTWTMDAIERIEVKASINVGEQNGSARLSVSNVMEIRSRCAAGETQASVAKAFGISQSTVSDIVRRNKWAHVE